MKEHMNMDTTLTIWKNLILKNDALSEMRNIYAQASKEGARMST